VSVGVRCLLLVATQMDSLTARLTAVDQPPVNRSGLRVSDACITEIYRGILKSIQRSLSAALTPTKTSTN